MRPVSRLAVATVETGLSRNGLVTLGVGLLGIFATSPSRRRSGPSPPVRALAYVGQRSFHVYAMHRGVITVATVAMVTLEISQSVVTDIGQVVLAWCCRSSSAKGS